MIEFRNVTKFFEHKGQKKYILKNASCKIPSDGNIFVFGKDGSGKSVTCKMIAGSSFPDSGRIKSDEKISWPLGFRGSLINNLTGRENIQLVCMVMGLNNKEALKIHKFVQDFTEIGKYYEMPTKTYAKSMKSRINFASAFAFEFDTYIMDDFSISSDSLLAEKAESFINSERKNSRLIYATKSLKVMENCKVGLLVRDQNLIVFDKISEAIAEYRKVFKNLSDAFTDEDEDSGGE